MALQAHKKFQISLSIMEHILMAFGVNVKIKFIAKKILSVNFILYFWLRVKIEWKTFKTKYVHKSSKPVICSVKPSSK